LAKVEYRFNPLEEIGAEIPRNKRAEARQAIADFVKESVLAKIADGKSPVSGGPWKRSLSKEYKGVKADQSGVGYANLELSGDLLDALEVVVDGSEVVLRVSGDQADKAEGNNLGSYGKSPDDSKARRFIPLEDETFKRDIWSGIREIASEFEDGDN